MMRSTSVNSSFPKWLRLGARVRVVKGDVVLEGIRCVVDIGFDARGRPIVWLDEEHAVEVDSLELAQEN